jgi:hypothetical protein
VGQPFPDSTALDGPLAAGSQLAQQPLLGGLAVQVGQPLSGELVADGDVHGVTSAWLSGA